MCSGSGVRGNSTTFNGNSGSSGCSMCTIIFFARAGAPSVQIQNKVVLITGASEGIGAACADAFRRRGARLALTARSRSKLLQVGGNETLIVDGDITDAAVREEVVTRT